MEDTEVKVQLAELNALVHSLAKSMEEIKTSVKEVVTLDRTIAELSTEHRHAVKEIHTQWVKIDDNQKDIEAVNRKTDEWINKGRGAWFTAMILGSLAQAAILGMIAWTFSHMRSAEDSILLMKEQLSRVEQQKGKWP